MHGQQNIKILVRCTIQDMCRLKV